MEPHDATTTKLQQKSNYTISYYLLFHHFSAMGTETRAPATFARKHPARAVGARFATAELATALELSIEAAGEAMRGAAVKGEVPALHIRAWYMKAFYIEAFYVRAYVDRGVCFLQGVLGLFVNVFVFCFPSLPRGAHRCGGAAVDCRSERQRLLRRSAFRFLSLCWQYEALTVIQ